MRQQRYPRQAPVGNYTSTNITQAVDVDTKIGKPGVGTFLGRILIAQAGTGVSLLLKDGSTVIGTFSIGSSMTALEFGRACDDGLYYQVSGTVGSIVVLYLDYVE